MKEAWRFGTPDDYRLAATKKEAENLLMYYYRDENPNNVSVTFITLAKNKLHEVYSNGDWRSIST